MTTPPERSDTAVIDERHRRFRAPPLRAKSALQEAADNRADAEAATATAAAAAAEARADDELQTDLQAQRAADITGSLLDPGPRTGSVPVQRP